MRNKDLSTNSFRRLLNELSMLMAYEVTRDMPMQEVEIETPLEKMNAKVIDGKKLVFVSILRAGTGILDGMERSFPPALPAEIARRSGGSVVAEPVRMGPVRQDTPPHYDLILDRISHEVPFYRTYLKTEAAKGAGHPWWLDLGIVKEGPGFEAMMAYNTTATPILTALRDGPLPRVTGPVYAVMGEAGQELVQTVGVSGPREGLGEDQARLNGFSQAKFVRDQHPRGDPARHGQRRFELIGQHGYVGRCGGNK
jgi:hypothetical protein